MPGRDGTGPMGDGATRGRGVNCRAMRFQGRFADGRGFGRGVRLRDGSCRSSMGPGRGFGCVQASTTDNETS